MQKINQIRILSLWIFVLPVIVLNLCLFISINYDLFEKRLNEIRLMPYNKYQNLTKEYAKYLMNYEPDCPAHKFIRKKIMDYV